MQNMASYYSSPDQFPRVEEYWSTSSSPESTVVPVPRLESSSSCDSGSSSKRHSSDEEFILASSNPKKRSGRKKFRETRHPVYRGVRRRNSGKWVCEVREPNKKTRIWLGTFPTLEMAARAHDVAMIALRGKSACLNFADSAWRLPVPASSDPKDIQKAALLAAEAFRPKLTEECYVEESDEAKEHDVETKENNDEAKEEAAAVAVAAAEEEEEKVWYMDEEAVFGMHDLLTSMAEGMMLPPPSYYTDDQVGGDADVSLWSFSF